MSDAPERIWLLWREIGPIKGRVQCSEQDHTDEGFPEYVRADLHEALAAELATARALIEVLEGEQARADKAEAERERLALAICGGEDAPGYANAQPVEALEKVARDAAAAHRADIDRLLKVEAERDAAIAALGEAARLQGEAEGKLLAAETPGVLEGWMRRAKAAEAALQRARDDALEEAAQVAEIRWGKWNEYCPPLVECDVSACEDIAAAIRAIKGGPHGHE